MCELKRLKRMEQNVLDMWEEGNKTRADVEGNRGRERPQGRRRDEVREFRTGRGLNKREGMLLGRERDRMSGIVFPTRKREAVTQGGTRGINHPTWRRTQGADIVKFT